MKTIHILITCTLLHISAIGHLSAQAFRNAGSAGAQFLKIGVGARAMGMGGAYTSLTGDATTLAWNPASIGPADYIQLSVQHTQWVAELDHNFVGLIIPLNDQFNLGFHTVYLTSGDIEITTIDRPEGTGTFYSVSDIAAGATMSARLTSQLAIATTVKYVEERIHDVTSGGVALDAGAWYATGYRSLTLGFSLSNLGFEQSFSGRSLEFKYTPSTPGEQPVNAQLQALSFSLPLTFRASGSFNFFEMFGERIEGHTLLTVIDFIQQSDTPERVVIGGEYTWENLISIRSGYQFNADELTWGTGGGVHLTVPGFLVNVDYSVSSLGRFGLGHRFGIALSYREN